jgi:hypothetical protein
MGVVPSCASTSVSGTDSNTHWLDQCRTDKEMSAERRANSSTGCITRWVSPRRQGRCTQPVRPASSRAAPGSVVLACNSGAASLGRPDRALLCGHLRADLSRANAPPYARMLSNSSRACGSSTPAPMQATKARSGGTRVEREARDRRANQHGERGERNTPRGPRHGDDDLDRARKHDTRLHQLALWRPRARARRR